MVQYAERRSFFPLPGPSGLLVPLMHMEITEPQSGLKLFFHAARLYLSPRDLLYIMKEHNKLAQSSAVVIAGKPPRGMPADLPYPDDDSGLRGPN
ncbi:hypothetical protein ABD76_17285 [Paenibacillus dendritiformis]|nr:hypothetical protein [Paenibacillus dendritiformis]